MHTAERDMGSQSACGWTDLTCSALSFAASFCFSFFDQRVIYPSQVIHPWCGGREHLRVRCARIWIPLFYGTRSVVPLVLLFRLGKAKHGYDDLR